jgi:hypothetical protein
VELLDPDHLTITAYDVHPEAAEAIASKTVLTRVK